MRTLPALTMLAVLSASGVAAVPAGSATTVVRKVTLGDDYFAPTRLTVRKGTTVRWLWPGDLANTHDVKLGRHPKGAKPFHSPPAAADFSFQRRLTVPGTYTIVCTLHVTMTMRIVVKSS
jgi:plastocyanin